MKNAHGGWLLLVNLQASKSNTPTWVLFTFFKLYKWYQIAQRITYKRCSSVYCKLSNIKTWTKPSIGVCLLKRSTKVNGKIRKHFHHTAHSLVNLDIKNQIYRSNQWTYLFYIKWANYVLQFPFIKWQVFYFNRIMILRVKTVK